MDRASECSVKVLGSFHCNYGEQKSDIADSFYFSSYLLSDLECPFKLDLL